MSTSEPKEKRIEKNTSTPTVQQICDLSSPYRPRLVQFMVIKARYVPITPNMIPDAPQDTVKGLLHNTDRMLPTI